MKLPSLAAFLLLALTCPAGAEDNPFAVKARTVYHADKTYTESTHDPGMREQREFTYSANHVLISKRIYLLNEKGQTVQGNVYDGRDVLKARAQFLFDELGRMSEERMTTLQGEVYQRILFGYDAQGNPLPPKSQTYNVQAPDMKAAVIDFTNPNPARGSMDRGQGGQPADGYPASQTPGNVPHLPPPGFSQQQQQGNVQHGVLPPIKVDMSPTEPPKKRSLWDRMLGRKDKDEKK